MKRKWFTKKWLVGLVVLGTLLVVTGVAVPVLAQTRQPPQGVSTGVYLDANTLARVAAVLGTTETALTDELKTGKTLAQIAAGKNVAESLVVDAIVAPMAEQLALQVKYGYITQEQSQTLLQNAKDRATALLQQDLTSASGNGYGCVGTGGVGGSGCAQGRGPVGGSGFCGNNSGTASPNAQSSGPRFGRGMMSGFGGMMRSW